MTIDELFAKAQSRAAENVQFVIDENLRIITVPESAAVFGVETDKDVNTAGFTINRFYSEVDLSEFSIRVSFANANNEMDFFDATDITVEDSTVSFNWLMGASAFKYKGNIQFAVNFFKADSSGTIQQAYNTAIATGQCLSGLNVNTADLPDTDYSELILHIQQQIQQTGQEQVQAVNDAGAQKLSQINAANAHPPQPNTATGVWQTWDAETGQYVDTTAPYRGPEGPQGDPGPTGPEGPPYTLTEEDKQTIVQAVIAALPDGDAVSYGAPEPGIVTTDNQYYTAIAAAIRQKLGTSTEYQPAQMAAAIQSISTATGIPVAFNGNPVVATDTIANQPFEGLKIYGKSTQDGTPTPESPVPIVSAGASGSIVLTITDGADQSQSFTISTPNGLPGIPVSSGGNFTDSTGQQLACDYVDFSTSQIESMVLIWRYSGQTIKTNKTVSGGTEFVIADKDIPGGIVKEGMSNKFTYESGESLNLNTFSSGYRQIWFRLPGSPTVDDAKSAVEGAYFVLQRESPVTTSLSAEEISAYKALKSYADTTVISTAEPVAGMEATVYCDAGATIQRLQGEIQTLSDATALNTQTLNTMLGAE